MYAERNSKIAVIPNILLKSLQSCEVMSTSILDSSVFSLEALPGDGRQANLKLMQ